MIGGDLAARRCYPGAEPGRGIFPGVRLGESNYGLAVTVKKSGGGVEGSRHLSLKQEWVILIARAATIVVPPALYFSFFQDIVIRYRAPDEMTTLVMKDCTIACTINSKKKL